MGLIVLEYFAVVLVGGVVLWLIPRLFFGDPVHIVHCFIAAAIAELVGLVGIPFVPFVVLYIFLVKFAGFDYLPAFCAVVLYGILKFIAAITIFASIAGI